MRILQLQENIYNIDSSNCSNNWWIDSELSQKVYFLKDDYIIIDNGQLNCDIPEDVIERVESKDMTSLLNAFYGLSTPSGAKCPYDLRGNDLKEYLEIDKESFMTAEITNIEYDSHDNDFAFTCEINSTSYYFDFSCPDMYVAFKNDKLEAWSHFIEYRFDVLNTLLEN